MWIEGSQHMHEHAVFSPSHADRVVPDCADCDAEQDVANVITIHDHWSAVMHRMTSSLQPLTDFAF